MKRKKVDAEHVFGWVLTEIRLEQGLSQEALSFECDLHRTHVSFLERGLRSPTLGTLVLLSRALGVPLSEIMRRFEKRLGKTEPRRRQRKGSAR